VLSFWTQQACFEDDDFFLTEASPRSLLDCPGKQVPCRDAETKFRSAFDEMLEAKTP
jgi:hypothetical protein